jgi:hypothetical protein
LVTASGLGLPGDNEMGSLSCRPYHADKGIVVGPPRLPRTHPGYIATREATTFLAEMRPGQPGFEKAVKVGYGLASDGRNPFYHPY